MAVDRVGAGRILGDHVDAVEPAVHEVAQRRRPLVDDVLARDQAVGDDVGRRRRRDQDVRLVLARLDRARQIRLPRDRGVDLLGLERGGGERRLRGEDQVLLDLLLVVDVRPDCDSRYRSSQCDGVYLVVAIVLPLRSSTLLMVLSDTMPSPPRDQSCWMIALAGMLFSASDDASRAHESTVSHMMSMSPLMNAVSFAAGSSMRTNFTSRPYLVL